MTRVGLGWYGIFINALKKECCCLLKSTKLSHFYYRVSSRKMHVILNKCLKLCLYKT